MLRPVPRCWRTCARASVLSGTPSPSLHRAPEHRSGLRRPRQSFPENPPAPGTPWSWNDRWAQKRKGLFSAPRPESARASSLVRKGSRANLRQSPLDLDVGLNQFRNRVKGRRKRVVHSLPQDVHPPPARREKDESASPSLFLPQSRYPARSRVTRERMTERNSFPLETEAESFWWVRARQASTARATPESQRHFLLSNLPALCGSAGFAGTGNCTTGRTRRGSRFGTSSAGRHIGSRARRQ